MGLSGSKLESLHVSLDRVSEACQRHLRDLEDCAGFDDAVIDPIGSEGPLSEEQCKLLDGIRSWMTSLWCLEQPRGINTLTAIDITGCRSLIDLVESLRLSRLAFVVSGAPKVGIEALDAIESALKACHVSLRSRLLTWPRPDIDLSTSTFLRMTQLLRDRRFNEIIEVSESMRKKVASPIEGVYTGTVTTSDELPIWNSEKFVVTFGNSEWSVPQGARRSPSVKILQAFHDAKWKHEVVLPEITDRQRKDALRTLKSKLPTLHFEKSNAYGVKWAKIE